MSRRFNVDERYVGGSLAGLKRELMTDRQFRQGWKLQEMAATLGQFASEMRRAASLTQMALAKILGVNQSLIARLESNDPDRFPTLATVARVANACGYDMEVAFQPKNPSLIANNAPVLVLRSANFLLND